MALRGNANLMADRVTNPNQNPNSGESSETSSSATNEGASGVYFLMRAGGVLRAQEDEFTSACFELGADGVAEQLAFKQRDLRYDPEIIESAQMDLSIYFDGSKSITVVEDARLRLQSNFPQVKLEVLTEENRDWLAEWKKGFVPFCFSGPFWVVPSWCEPPSEVAKSPMHVLFVEPGMAFGTGTHETTRLAAGILIDECGRKTPVASGRRSVLDVGTGTGILAVVARRLGCGPVVGIDIDPEARRTARENLELNREAEIEIADADLKDVEGPYDIVVANIIDGVLTILADDLNRVLKPGGRMVLSGVLADRESEFYESFTSKTGMKLLKKTAEGEWTAALLEKPAVNS